MNQRSFILSILVVIIAFLFFMGGVAIYVSGQSDYSDQSYSKDTSRSTSKYENNIVVNYPTRQQAPVQPTVGRNCNQQIVGYSNYQPIVDCVPTQGVTATPSSPDVKINIQMSGGYAPYPYYYPYYRYYPTPRYYPYYPRYPYYPKYNWGSKYWW